MKFIDRYDQNKVLQCILDIFTALVKHDDIESKDAIIAAYRIAFIVGGKKMVKKLEGNNEDSNMDSGRLWRRGHSRTPRTRK